MIRLCVACITRETMWLLWGKQPCLGKEMSLDVAFVYAVLCWASSPSSENFGVMLVLAGFGYRFFYVVVTSR